jgi:hypothetical protein
MFEVTPNIKDSVQFSLGEKAFDPFILRKKGFEIFALFPDPHRIPLDYAVSLFSR